MWIYYCKKQKQKQKKTPTYLFFFHFEVISLERDLSWLRTKLVPGLVADTSNLIYTCNISTWRLRQEGPEFKASLGYTAKNCLKKGVGGC
jgi:hypothetical protein